MSETRATMTELRQNLADLINRAAYGGERIVLVSHGEPKAVIIGIDELNRLQGMEGRPDISAEAFRNMLAEADRISQRIQARQEAHEIEERRRLDGQASQDGGHDEQSKSDQLGRALAAAAKVRQEMKAWQEAHGIVPEDSVETLRRLREERDADIQGLR